MHGCYIHLYLVNRNLQNIPVTGVLSSSVTFNKDSVICLSVDLSLTTYVNEMFVIMSLPSHTPPPLPYYLSLFCTNCIYNTNENEMKFLHVIKKW